MKCRCGGLLLSRSTAGSSRMPTRTSEITLAVRGDRRYSNRNTNASLA